MSQQCVSQQQIPIAHHQNKSRKLSKNQLCLHNRSFIAVLWGRWKAIKIEFYCVHWQYVDMLSRSIKMAKFWWLFECEKVDSHHDQASNYQWKFCHFLAIDKLCRDKKVSRISQAYHPLIKDVQVQLATIYIIAIQSYFLLIFCSFWCHLEPFE